MTPKSGALLGACCLTAISAVASMFELSTGDPDWGLLPTEIFLAVCVASTVAFFYAAVKDAKANQQ